MLFSELSKLTKGECTQEEYDAVNAVYMTLDDMSKEDAAALWRKLYARKHREARKAADAKSRSIEFLASVQFSTTLPNGDYLHVEPTSRRDWNNERHLFIQRGTIATGSNLEYIGTIADYGHRLATGNPYGITIRGKLLA